jgi:hypothetical protein
MALPACLQGQTVSDRATVFVLVDESGTMRRDAQGWRKEAAALLAYSLPAGDSLVISGFGNPGRKLELDPMLVGDSENGRQDRLLLATRSRNLGDSDQKTDIYGVLRAALDRISSIDPHSRELSPATIVMLSDFKPDPEPDPQSKQDVCRMLSQYRTTFLGVGFGDVDRKNLEYLGDCAHEQLGVRWTPRRLFSASFGSFSTG